MKSDEDTAAELVRCASALLPVVRSFPRRAFVVELTGSPKAGKTSSIKMVANFFKRCGFNVHVLREQAEVCPLTTKAHFHFNAWTTCSTIAEFIAKLDADDLDILIIDRGLFDALVWLEIQEKRGQVSATEKHTFEDFVLMERWRSRTDLTILMTVSPGVAVERAKSTANTLRKRSVVNEEFIGDFNSSIEELRRRHCDKFQFVAIDTTSTASVLHGSHEIIQELLRRIETFADPRIAVLPRESIVRRLGKRALLTGVEAQETLSAILAELVPMKRSEAEAAKEHIQIVAGACLFADTRLLELERKDLPEDSNQSPTAIWKGAHVLHSAEMSTSTLLGTIRERLLDDLYLEHSEAMNLLGLVWDEEAQASHIGAIFRLPITQPAVENGLLDRNLRKLRKGPQRAGHFRTPREILSGANLDSFDPWSTMILEHLVREGDSSAA